MTGADDVAGTTHRPTPMKTRSPPSHDAAADFARLRPEREAAVLGVHVQRTATVLVAPDASDLQRLQSG